MRKKILMVTTGGTIAMKKDVKTGGLLPAVTGGDLADSVPELRDMADVEVFPFRNVPSGWMSSRDMLALSKCIDEKAQSGYDGFVVTHGTDTLEETAFFLAATIKTDIPICVTGAMRGASVSGADGPANIRSAVQVVADDSSPKLVTVCLNDRVYDAWTVTKRHTVNTDTFGDFEWGPIGIVYTDRIVYGRKPQRHVKIDAHRIEEAVWIITCWSGMDGGMPAAAVACGAKGLVVAGLGCGNVPPDCKKAIEAAREAGLPVVLTSRVPAGRVAEEYGYDGSALSMKQSGIILGGALSPWKARLLLGLALGQGADNETIRSYFMEREGMEP